MKIRTHSKAALQPSEKDASRSSDLFGLEEIQQLQDTFGEGDECGFLITTRGHSDYPAQQFYRILFRGGPQSGDGVSQQFLRKDPRKISEGGPAKSLEMKEERTLG